MAKPEAASGENAGLFLSAEESPHDQHEQRAERRDSDRAKVQIALAHAAPAQADPDHSAEQRADNAERDGENAPSRVAARHDELGERTGDEAEQQPEEPKGHRRTIGMYLAEIQCAQQT